MSPYPQPLVDFKAKLPFEKNLREPHPSCNSIPSRLQLSTVEYNKFTFKKSKNELQ